MLRRASTLLTLFVVAACGAGSGNGGDLGELDPLPEGASYAEAASHCSIEDPVFGAVKLFGDIDSVGFVMDSSVAPRPVPRERQGEDLVPVRMVCLSTQPSDAIKGCGVAEVSSAPETFHAESHRVTPVLFLPDTSFVGTSTYVFGSCPGGPDGRDPLLFDVDASLVVEPTPFPVGSSRIADVIDQAIAESEDLDAATSMSAAECDSLSELVGRAEAFHADLRELLGGSTLFPEETSIDLSNQDQVLEHIAWMRSRYLTSVLDETSMDSTVTAVKLSNVAWEDFVLGLEAASDVPVELRPAWVHWHLGVALDRPFVADTEANLRHLDRVLDTHCA